MSGSEVPNTDVQPPGDPLGEPGARKGHLWVWIFVILLIVGGVVLFRMRSSSPLASMDQSGDQPISVGATTVHKQDMPYYLTGLGSVTAFNTVTVRPRVEGQIMKIHFREGQFVHAGDLLAEIDPRPYQVALDQAQGQLAKDTASLNDAKANLDRYRQLWQQGVIPRQQFDSQQATVGQFDGAIQSDKAQIDNEKLQLTYCRITAPIDGRVGLRQVDSGNIVHPTDATGIAVITQVRPIAVIFTLPEDDLPQVVAEMRNKQLSVEAYGRDNNTKIASGRLLTIDNQIDQTTGTIKLKAQFDNQGLSLWPNQFVNVRLFLTVRKDAIVIPSAAIQKGSQGSFVYAVGSDNKAVVRPVQVEFSEGNVSVIREGLEEGNKIVVDGQDKLHSGAAVTVHPAGSSPAPATNPPPELQP
ncbi:MAG TPA: MdtA/MuxA family multidrug efflux RND transporter periplasmic adaptor subunit [Candidatus Polarisedimenticolia bacterium]|nr:MdtA/MuxA family multidrug efflux RND transporter periplasmic adaptor subunit [Candidatus Polarisedimenticolia bacterium]